MTESIEVCHIREEYIRTEWRGLLRGLDYNRFVAETVGASGNQIVAHSIEFQDPDGRDNRLPQIRANALNQLLQQLMNEGWEVMTSDEHGEAKSLKRQKFSASRSTTGTAADLLKQLASLRDAGILTEDEFKSKKAEILKRM